MENLTSQDFVFLAVKGFGLGFTLGFLTWGFSYVVKTLRRTFISSMKILDVS